MNKKIFGIALVLLALFAVGVIYAQVCVISAVSVTGYGTNTVTFTNNSTQPQFVRVEVKWDDNKFSREFGREVPAAREFSTGSGNSKKTTFRPGELKESVPGIITSIKECF